MKKPFKVAAWSGILFLFVSLLRIFVSIFVQKKYFFSWIVIGEFVILGILGVFFMYGFFVLGKKFEIKLLSISSLLLIGVWILFITFSGIAPLLFINFYTPGGVEFNTYSVSVINVSDMKIVGKSNFIGMSEIEFHNKTFYAYNAAIEDTIRRDEKQIVVYDDSPAFNAQMKGAIIEIDGKKITNLSELQNAISNLKPRENVAIKTIQSSWLKKEIKTYNIQVGEKEGHPFIGISFISVRGGNIFTKYSNSNYFIFLVLFLISVGIISICNILFGIGILKLEKIRYAKAVGILEIISGATYIIFIGFLVKVVAMVLEIIMFFNLTKKYDS